MKEPLFSAIYLPCKMVSVLYRSLWQKITREILDNNDPNDHIDNTDNNKHTRESTDNNDQPLFEDVCHLDIVLGSCLH